MSHPVYERVDLAHAEPFSLGDLWVEPAFRLVRSGELTEIVEPRIMQLLVALRSSNGTVLSRDDLMQLCWGNIVVGENALQRAVSEARKIAAAIGAGSFEIETVRGIGYRLVERDGSEPLSNPAAVKTRSPLTRRSAIVLLGVGGAAAATSLIALLPDEESATKLARGLYDRAQVALRDENEESSKQAIALLKDAVRESPRFADAWAALGLAYWQRGIGLEGGASYHFAKLAASAARHALAIDSGNVDARVVLAIVRPDFRRWRQAEKSFEVVAGAGNSWVAQRYLGWVASDLGEWNSAIDRYRAALSIEPLLPRVHRDLALACWGAGLPIETEQTLAEATRLWPANYGLWEFQFRYFALSGNHSKASRLITDEATQPLGLGPVAITKRLRLLEALDGKGGRDFVIRTYAEETRRDPMNTVRVAQVFAALGANEEVYALLEGYFLARGPFGVPIAPYALRPTYFLYLPPMLKLHSDPRIAEIIASIGLKPVA